MLLVFSFHRMLTASVSLKVWRDCSGNTQVRQERKGFPPFTHFSFPLLLALFCLMKPVEVRDEEKLKTLCILSPGLKNILPITTAKVPIVKFYHVRTGLEGDISLYNTLVGLFHFPPYCLTIDLYHHMLWFCLLLFQALHNTHLLASYAAIDRRVKILCYVMKVFAKVIMLQAFAANTFYVSLVFNFAHV